jgi:hypothetical protein
MWWKKQIFAKISAIFVNFCYDIFAKTKINVRKNFCQNAKAKIFVSTLAKTVKWGEGRNKEYDIVTILFDIVTFQYDTGMVTFQVWYRNVQYDIVTFQYDIITFQYEIVTFLYDIVTFQYDIVTFHNVSIWYGILQSKT